MADFKDSKGANLTQEEIDKLIEELLKNRTGGDALTEKEVAAMVIELQKYLPADQVDMFLKKIRTRIWG
ncbi:MAG: hypothetical protein IKW97_02740 [Muribaculaceae bacterium]|nr:hypothetical protein [Muribaculaceae bacterium]